MSFETLKLQEIKIAFTSMKYKITPPPTHLSSLLKQISAFVNLQSLDSVEFCGLQAEGCGSCSDGMRSFGTSSYRSSKGSKLVIRRSKGSKFSGCNFQTQIYDMASGGLYSIESTPLTSPARGYCKSPSMPIYSHI